MLLGLVESVCFSLMVSAGCHRAGELLVLPAFNCLPAFCMRWEAFASDVSPFSCAAELWGHGVLQKGWAGWFTAPQAPCCWNALPTEGMCSLGVVCSQSMLRPNSERGFIYSPLAESGKSELLQYQIVGLISSSARCFTGRGGRRITCFL